MSDDWRNHPATEKQLAYLQSFGFSLDSLLTKGEACDLIDKFSDEPESQRKRDQNNRKKYEQDYGEREHHLAYHLRLELKEAKQNVEEAEPDESEFEKEDFKYEQEARLVFWKNTFRDVNLAVEDFNEQWSNLYLNWGYRFRTPTDKQIQDLLDALDVNSSTWDRDMPEYFFQTLEFNFPDLLLTMPPTEEVARKHAIFKNILQNL